MSVLRNKIYRESGLPDTIKDALSVWKPLHCAISDCLAELAGGEWVPLPLGVVQVGGKVLFSNYPEEGLAFGFVTSDSQVPVFAHFDKSFAAMISSMALGVSAPKVDDEYGLQMLDLILFKPVRDVIISEFAGLLASAGYNNSKLLLKSQGLSVSSVEVDRGLGAMIEFTFPVKRLASEEEVEAGASDQELMFTLVLPESAVLKVATARAGSVSEPDLAPHGPWADKIYESMKTAEVPIRAVVESCSMTVADCTRLEVDDIIQLPGASLQSVSLQTDMRDGAIKIGVASLGIYKTNWALKLSGDLNEEIFVSLKTQNVDG